MSKVSMQLSEKKCRACEGWEKPFTKAETQKYLRHVKNWKLMKNEIEKEFQFKDFKQALAFINKIGKIAESEGHHPDIFLHGWNKVKLMLSTHAIKGLSENDFIMAAKVDNLGKE